MKRSGVDLGGTKIECAVIDGEEILIRRRIPTESEKGCDRVGSKPDRYRRWHWKYLFNPGELKTPVLKPILGDSAGVFGAALLN